MQNKVIEEEIEATPSPSAFRVILREFLKDRVAIVSLAIALIII